MHEGHPLPGAVYDDLPADGYIVRIPGLYHADFGDTQLLSPLLRPLGLSGPVDGGRPTTSSTPTCSRSSTATSATGERLCSTTSQERGRTCCSKDIDRPRRGPGALAGARELLRRIEHDAHGAQVGARAIVDVDQHVARQGAWVMATEQTVRVATSPIVLIAPRYADLADRVLAAALSGEDVAEEVDGLNPLERITCRLHRRWLHHCVSSPAHVIAVTGHRWCRSCECAANIAVDELTADIRVTCPRCGGTPHGPATRQIVRCCRASVAAAAAQQGT